MTNSRNGKTKEFTESIKVAKKEIAKITAEQLIDRLKIRRDFMNDIVDLVEGIMREGGEISGLGFFKETK